MSGTSGPGWELRCAGLAALTGVCLLAVNDIIGSRAAAVLVGVLFAALAWPPPRQGWEAGAAARVVPLCGAHCAEEARPQRPERASSEPRLGARSPDRPRAPEPAALAAQLRELRRECEAARQQEERARRQAEAARAEAERAQQQAAALRERLEAEARRQAEQLAERERRAAQLQADAEAQGAAERQRAERLAEQLASLRGERDGLQEQLEGQREQQRRAAERTERAQAAAEEAAARASGLAQRLRDAAEEAEEAGAVAEQARQQEQQALRMCREARLEAEQASLRASILQRQLEELRDRGLEAATAPAPAGRAAEAPARGESQGAQGAQGPGQAKWAAKLAAQLRELQEEHDEALRQRDGLRVDLERGRDELAEQRHALRKLQLELQREKERAQKLDAELQSEQREGRAHRRERLRRQGSLPSLRAVSFTDKVSDSAAIEALGGILQRSMRDLPAERRQNFKRQLLLCFHPDRNPATEVATRVTQILTDSR